MHLGECGPYRNVSRRRKKRIRKSKETPGKPKENDSNTSSIATSTHVFLPLKTTPMSRPQKLLTSSYENPATDNPSVNTSNPPIYEQKTNEDSYK